MDGLLEAPLVPKRLVCVNFPGFVKSVGRAVEVLGGESKISKALSGGSQRLEAHLRPKDVESIPLYATKVPCCGLVLRVRRRKTPLPEGSEERPASVEVLGCVSLKYEFSGLADFQYLPAKVEKAESGPVTFSHATSITGPLSAAALMETDFLHIPTFLFCRSDRPLTFRAYSKPRVDRPVSAQFIPYNEDVVPPPPTVPHKHFYTPAFQQMFEERPVWSTQAFFNTALQRVGKRVSVVIVKKINSTLAYMFSSGPWRLCWVKRGYDPRTDPDAYKYQVLDFRSKRSVYRGKPEKSRPQRLTSSLGPTAAKCPSQASTVSLIKNADDADSAATDDFESHVYQPGKQVNQGQKLFQVCDVRLEDVKEKMEKGRIGVCTEKDGWLSAGTMDAMRAVLTQHVTEADGQTPMPSLTPQETS